MTSFQKTTLILITVILVGSLYVFNTQDNTPTLPTEQPDVTPTTITTVTPNGICGLFVTSHNVNGKASLQKPITVSGIIDNTDHQTRGCSWQMFEGQAGTAQAFAYVDNQWKSISKQTYVPVPNWMTTKTTFKVELTIDTGVMNIAAGTPLKVVFTEENASGEPPVDIYTLPLITTHGELQ